MLKLCLSQFPMEAAFSFGGGKTSAGQAIWYLFFTVSLIEPIVTSVN
jgi:hypothetical protein